MSKDKRNIIIIVVLGLLAVGAIVYFWIFQTRSSMTGTRAEIAKLETDIQKFQRMIDKIPQLREEREEIELVVEEFSQILPDDAIAEQHKLSAMIEDFAKETKIELRKFEPIVKQGPGGKPGAQAEKEAFEENVFELEISGHFFDFVTLINQIERNEKFIKVDSFSCKRMGKDQRAGDLTMLVCKVVLSFYTYRPVNAATGP
jgi:Tfp pilus assembly protein PilO